MTGLRWHSFERSNCSGVATCKNRGKRLELRNVGINSKFIDTRLA